MLPYPLKLIGTNSEAVLHFIGKGGPEENDKPKHAHCHQARTTLAAGEEKEPERENDSGKLC